MSDSQVSSDRPSGQAPWALVTGAARRIGATIATALHHRGCRVLVHYHGSADEANELADSLNAARADSARAVHADLSETRSLERLVATVKQTTSSLDILVNNASRFYPTPVGQTTTASWDGLMDTNLRGPFLLTQALLSELRTAGGSVINILDIHADRPMPNHAVYSASKAGLAMLTRSLALELAPEVRVNGVAPGAILWPERSADGEERERILRRIPMGRIGEPGDIASAVNWLALDAPYVTGQVIAVDGGRSVTL